MAINQWPSDERPREKLLARGADALSDAELLAIFIRTGVQGKTAVDVGRDLIDRFGGLRQILNASKAQLCEVSGIGITKYALLQAAVELGNRYLAQKLHKDGPLSSPKQAGDYLTHRLRDQSREVFAILYLDTRHQVLDYEELFVGTHNGASVYPREVIRNTLARNAAAVILAHNHPSGIAEPSQADISLTIRLRDALAMVDVKLLDHLVIGDDGCVSMSELGLF